MKNGDILIIIFIIHCNACCSLSNPDGPESQTNLGLVAMASSLTDLHASSLCLPGASLKDNDSSSDNDELVVGTSGVIDDKKRIRN